MKKQFKLLLSLCFLFMLLSVSTKAYAAAITWTWDTTGQLTKSVRVQTNAATTIHWGDGNSEEISTIGSDVLLAHTYTAAGSYTVTIADNVITKFDACSDEVGEKITSLDVSGATALTYLDCGYGSLTSLDVSANTNLTHLACHNNQLTSLNLANNRNLTFLDISKNNLSTIDVSANTALIHLDVASTGITALDVSTNVALVKLYCGQNNLTTLDVRQNANLSILCCAQASMTNLYVTTAQATNLTVVEEKKVCVEETTNVIHKYPTTVIVPDVPLASAITMTWDATGDLTKVVTVQATGATTINWGDGNSDTISASAEDVVLTHTYTAAGSYTVTVIDNVLTKFDVCSDEVGEKITSLDVSGATALTYLDCGYGSLTSLDVSANVNLTHLACHDNQLTSLNLANNTNLTFLDVSRNSLSEINVSANTALTYLDVAANGLTTIDVSANTALVKFYCGENQLTELNVRSNPNLSVLCCAQVSLTDLYITAEQSVKLTVVEEIDACIEERDNTLHKYASTVITLDRPLGVITWIWDATGDLTKTVVVKTTAETTINWGDGATETIPASAADNPLTHTYAAEGSYNVAIIDNVVTKFDVSNDQEGEKVTTLNVSAATALTTLDCGFNEIPALDVSLNTGLTYLDCSNNKLTVLNVSANRSLTYLECGANQLTALDVSSNTALTELRCYSNQLTSLNVTANTGLTYLNCSKNSISTINVSGNVLLTHLDVAANNLTILDVSMNTALVKLYCGRNQLVTLDVRQNASLSILCCAQSSMTELYVTATQNATMTVIEEDEVCITQGENKIHKSSTTEIVSDAVLVWTWEATAEQLTKTIFVSTTAETTIDWGDGVTETIPASPNADKTLTHTYAAGTYTASIADDVVIKFKIENMQVTNLNPNGAIALSFLYASSNKLSSIDVGNNTNLRYLMLENNQLTNIDISNLTNLEKIQLGKNQLTSLDVTNNTVLSVLWCYDNQLGTLDVSKNVNLQVLHCYRNNLTILNISQNTMLTTLGCHENQLVSLDLHANTALTTLSCENNSLESLDLSMNLALTYLRCNSNRLTELNLDVNTALTEIYCGNNQLAVLDVSANTVLNKLCCVQPTLTTLYLNVVQMSSMTIENKDTACAEITTDKTIHKYPTTELSIDAAIWWTWDTTNQLTKTIIVKTTGETTIDWGDGSVVETVATSSSNLTLTHTYTIAGNYTVAITDNVVKYFNGDGQKLKAIDVSQNTILEVLSCSDNLLSSIDITSNTALDDLYCYNNSLTNIDVSQNVKLKKLNVGKNQLTSLNISNNRELTLLYCNSNSLTTLDISNNEGLTTVRCYENQLTVLNISNNMALTYLWCSKNALTNLDIATNQSLNYLNCTNNQLTTLDLSNNPALTEVYCGGNRLTTLDITRNSALNKLCCVQSTLATLILDEIQMDNMTVVSETTPCGSITTDATIHKYPSTQLNVIGVAIKIQPSAVAITNMKLPTAYAKVNSMLNDPIYGVTANGSSILASHMMKNTEWGAVAYLTNAIGRSPYRNISPYFTGFAASTPEGMAEEYGMAWDTAGGVKASTTHNVFGVYDMNGGREEFVGAYVTDRGADPVLTGSSETKDVDKYTEVSDTMNYKGGALSETGNFTEGKSWNGSLMVTNGTDPYVVRGGWYYTTDDAQKSGMFMAYPVNGTGNGTTTFRPVIVVKKAE